MSSHDDGGKVEKQEVLLNESIIISPDEHDHLEDKAQVPRINTNREEKFCMDVQPEERVNIVKNEISLAGSFPVALGNDNVNELVKSMILKTDNTLQCQQCGKTGTHSGTMQRHVETHIEGAVHTCSLCGKTARSSHALLMHKIRYHKMT